MNTYSNFDDDINQALKRTLLRALMEQYEGEFKAFALKRGVPRHDADAVLNDFWLSVWRMSPLTKMTKKGILYNRLKQVLVTYWRSQNSKKRTMIELWDSPPEIAQPAGAQEPRTEDEENRLERRIFEEYPSNLTPIEKRVLYRGLRGYCLDLLSIKLKISSRQTRVILRRAIRKFRWCLNNSEALMLLLAAQPKNGRRKKSITAK